MVDEHDVLTKRTIRFVLKVEEDNSSLSIQGYLVSKHISLAAKD